MTEEDCIKIADIMSNYRQTAPPIWGEIMEDFIGWFKADNKFRHVDNRFNENKFRKYINKPDRFTF